MRATIIGVSALLLSVGAINLGLGLQVSLLGLRAGLENFSLVTTGLVMSSFYAGIIIGTFVSPPLVNRVGHIRTFAAFASLMSAAALIHAVFVDPIAWIAFRAFTGICFAALSLVGESWLNERATNQTRGTLLSIYFVTILAASALGQVLLPLAPVSGFELFVLVSIIVSVALVPVALTSSPSPAIAPARRLTVRELMAISPVGLAGCFGAGLITGAFWGLGAVYAQAIGLSTGDIAVFMTALIAGGIVTQWPLGRLSDVIDRRLVIAGVTFALAIIGAWVASGLIDKSPLLFLAAALSGGLMLPVYGLSIAHTNDFVDADKFVPASESLLLVYGCGATAGPVIATVAMNSIGPGGLFIYAAIVGGALGLFTLYRITRRPSVPRDEAGRYAAVPRTTAMVFELDPRSEAVPEADRSHDPVEVVEPRDPA